MEKMVISTNNAPAAIGPYSQAIKMGNLVFVSGQIPIIPKTRRNSSGGYKTSNKTSFGKSKKYLRGSRFILG